MGSVILPVHFCTKVAVFWTHTSKMVTTSFNTYVMTNTKIVSSQPYIRYSSLAYKALLSCPN